MTPASEPNAYDLVIIGAGEAGQAAAHLARTLGGKVAIIDRELFGGSCPYWACMPSKACCMSRPSMRWEASSPGSVPRTFATG